MLADLAAQASASQPIALLSNDGTIPGSSSSTRGRGGGSSGAVSFDRIAPCLLPEQQQVSAVRVTGPRYWHQLLAREAGSRSSGPSLDALYRTRTLFVQRKAGALPYADDPSGQQARQRCAYSPLPVMERITSICLLSCHKDFAAIAGVRSLLSRMVHQGGGGGDGASGVDDSFDLVTLCSTFGSDPAVMSFANVSQGILIPW